MSKNHPAGAAKKARWSTADKMARTDGPKKPHRGQSGPGHAGRTSRPASSGSTHVGGREWRAPRDERGTDRPSFNRDDRGSDRGGYQRRDDRPSFKRDDRGSDRGGYQRRDDRPSFNRDDRGSDRGGYQRRDDRTSDRGGYQRRDDRPSFNRDDRGSDRGGYQRRDDRPSDRGGYQRRDDRPSFNRDDRGARPSFNRDDRGSERSSDRGGYQRRDDRPSFNRDDRGARPSSNRGSDRPSDRTSDRGGFQRRDDRPSFRRDDRPTTGGVSYEDAEAERMDADTWVKSTRTVTDGPVEVAGDNGFAALGIPSAIVERLAREGITTPFPIQTATIPDALAGKDVLGRGQTGSGKTLAFGLPVITRLLEAGATRRPRKPHALIMTPTRELAMQISDALEPLVHVAGLRHKLVAGGLSYTTQINALNKGVDILIATPGRLNDLIERGAVELDDIAITVLDEADHMAEMGFMAEITTSLNLIPAGGQRLLFSATLDRGIDQLVATYLTDPVVHSTDDATASVETMEHHVLLIDPQHKKVITAEVANREGRTVVFCRTKLGADRIALQLREQGVMAAALHGGLNQGARNRVLGAFRDGTLPVLVATDVAARGIHVDDVSVVLQVDPPADHKDYLHRSGRTARAGENGTVVTLALPHQRRTMERQLKDAGLDISPVRATPGDATIAATGATPPSGVAIDEADFTRLLAGPKPQRRGPAGARGPRSGASGGYRPHHARAGREGGHDDRRNSGRDSYRGRPDRHERGDRGDRLVSRWSDDGGRGRG
ncbi:DEAD/DEAH box helicase [Terracoccus luteus]|uniref:Superfamily II DNA/RNA helicase n=1 Tax=Terracoccus luteus TaxID=53356 RepID=A0A839PTT9_9MICO|nr:DEAD/DEAH box helicase [Terracoccus luteus]MBB2986927.1 superfamily II DNA/RNA helicase [Terracoccus luteus]MCP2172578.1 superfamily II DNA/RNA helicase [Terracoccus luteus]